MTTKPDLIHLIKLTLTGEKMEFEVKPGLITDETYTHVKFIMADEISSSCKKEYLDQCVTSCRVGDKLTAHVWTLKEDLLPIKRELVRLIRKELKGRMEQADQERTLMATMDRVFHDFNY